MSIDFTKPIRWKQHRSVHTVGTEVRYLGILPDGSTAVTYGKNNGPWLCSACANIEDVVENIPPEPRKISKWMNVWKVVQSVPGYVVGETIFGTCWYSSKSEAEQAGTGFAWKLLDTIEVSWTEKA